MNDGGFYDPNALFDVARERGYDAVRQWYSGYWIFSVLPDGLQGGNPYARVAARAGAASDLASALNAIKTDLERRRINIIQAATAARPLVGATARTLWLTAQYVHNPFAAPLTLEEEFENYRVVANFLAMDLLRLSAACYYAGGSSPPSVPPPVPATPPPSGMSPVSELAGMQAQQRLSSGSAPNQAEAKEPNRSP